MRTLGQPTTSETNVIQPIYSKSLVIPTHQLGLVCLRKRSNTTLAALFSLIDNHAIRADMLKKLNAFCLPGNFLCSASPVSGQTRAAPLWGAMGAAGAAGKDAGRRPRSALHPQLPALSPGRARDAGRRRAPSGLAAAAGRAAPHNRLIPRSHPQALGLAGAAGASAHASDSGPAPWAASGPHPPHGPPPRPLEPWLRSLPPAGRQGWRRRAEAPTHASRLQEASNSAPPRLPASPPPRLGPR